MELSTITHKEQEILMAVDEDVKEMHVVARGGFNFIRFSTSPGLERPWFVTPLCGSLTRFETNMVTLWGSLGLRRGAG